MNLVTAEHLTKSYTERLLFDDTDFAVNEGEKIGVIGINGTGKSTLLRLVAGLEEPDQGTVTRGRNLDIRYLPQNPKFTPKDTVLQSIVRDNEGHEHPWDLESQAKTMLTKVGIFDFDQEVGTLSGGQRKRVALVSALMSDTDLLILDEPTNHLDSQMAEWLEDYLKRFRGAIVKSGTPGHGRGRGAETPVHSEGGAGVDAEGRQSPLHQAEGPYPAV